MKGHVDDENRALIEVLVRPFADAEAHRVTAWVDTGFNGHLVLTSSMIKDLELPSLAAAEAILGDGKKVTLEAFDCYIEWFGKILPIQVIANEGSFPLLGAGLFTDRILHIDYQSRIINLD